MAESAAPKKALILGATGAVGKVLLNELVAAPQYTQVHAFVRRAFKAHSAHSSNDKLVEHVVDFDKLVQETGSTEASSSGTEAQKLRDIGADGVFITLGTTRAAAGSFEAFERIDRDYVLAAARAALSSDEGRRAAQRVVYCSSTSASSKSPFPYLKSKGLTEEGLASAGYGDCVLFRPGFLAEANRPKTRYMEAVYGFAVCKIGARFSDSLEIRIPLLAKAMCAAGIRGSAHIGVGSAPGTAFAQKPAGPGAKLSTIAVVSNAEAKKLAASA